MREYANEITKKYQDYIEECEAKIKLWENVKIVTKKNGEPFQAFAKNFENCKIYADAYTLQTNAKNITVSGRTVSGKWVEDEIGNTDLVKYTKFNVEPERIIKESFLEPYFFLTIQEIGEKIAEKIEKYKNNIKAYKMQLEKVAEYVETITNKVNALQAEIKEMTKDFDTNSLYYDLIKIVKDVY